MTGGHGRISMSGRGTTCGLRQDAGGRKVHLGVAAGSANGRLGLATERAVEATGSRDVTRSEAQFTGREKAEAMINTMRTLNSGLDKAIATLAARSETATSLVFRSGMVGSFAAPA